MQHEQEIDLLFEGILCISVPLWNCSKNVNSSLEPWSCVLVDPCDLELTLTHLLRFGAVALPRNCN